MRKKLQVIKILIVVFSVLLAIGLSALAGILLFGRTERVTGFASVTDNYILPSSSKRDRGKIQKARLYGAFKTRKIIKKPQGHKALRFSYCSLLFFRY